MKGNVDTENSSPVVDAARRARFASRALGRLSADLRNEILLAAAGNIETNSRKILEANEADAEAAGRGATAAGISSAMLARLRLSERGIAEMAERIRGVAGLPDPLGRRLSVTELDEGLTLSKVSVPLGVVGVIFESRPDVVPQVASLALKSGNALLLKGGAEAFRTNQVLVSLWRETLSRFPAVPVEAVHLLESRADVEELLSLEREIDVIIPRGSREFVEHVSKNSRVPVLGHGEGLCHVYVDRAADIDKAIRVAFDSKVDYPAACNAAETLLVHEAIAKEFLPRMVRKLTVAGTEVRGCAKTIALLAREEVRPATEEDWSTEYSGLILSVKVVGSVDEAMAHIHRYGSRHTETIVTEDDETASRFLAEIDAAGVYHNASTRFADGYRYGLGAELGISNSKLHARGPVGLEGLTTYKYILVGRGHTVGEYTKGEKQFHHKRVI
jgi:glutamate-5-semialdehyde dehydrogenase